MNTITSVYKELERLGATIPSGVWNDLKTKNPALSLLTVQDKDTGVEYLPQNCISYLRSIYEKLYAGNTIKEYKYIIDNKGFNSSEEIKGYLSQMLKEYRAGNSLNQQDKAFLEDLLSRNFNIKKEVEKYGKVADLIVDIKEGYSGKSFHIIYSNGRKQHISMKNYTDPGTEVLVDLWGKNDN